MQLKDLLSSPAVNVFLGTLPLLLTIAWGLFSNERRLTRIEGKLDTIDTKLVSLGERMVRVETRIDGGRVVMGD